MLVNIAGLTTCSKPAAKSRLQLAQHALDHHGSKVCTSWVVPRKYMFTRARAQKAPNDRVLG